MFPLRPYFAKLVQHFKKLAEQVFLKCVKSVFSCLFTQISALADEFAIRISQIVPKLMDLAQAQKLRGNIACSLGTFI